MTSAAPSAPNQIDRQIARVCLDLVHALERLIAQVGQGPVRPQELARRLNLNKSLASRLCRVVRSADPVAAAHLMPGPEALRMVLEAARRSMPSGDPTVPVLDRAIGAFEELIRRDLGDRAALDALLSETIPEARERFEMTNKQAAFRAMANLKAVRAELQLTTVFVHPGLDPGALDCVTLAGLLGLRRLRPGALVQVYSEHLDPLADRDLRETLDGRMVEGVQELLLREHCTQPPPRLETRRDGRRVIYCVGGNGVGLHSAVDLVFAERQRGWLRRYRIPGGHPTAGAAATIDQPTATLLFDMFVHRDAWPGVEPQLFIYDTVIRGTAHPEDITRTVDRLDLLESIRPLGWGLSKARAADVPRYLDMLEHVCRSMSWEPDALRGYRCRIRYPIYGTQICMSFALRSPPEHTPT